MPGWNSIIQMEQASYFFSERTGAFDVIVPRELIWGSINQLSKLNCVHVIDKKQTGLNQEAQFSTNLKNAQDLLTKVLSIKEDIKRFRSTEAKQFEPYPGILEDIDALTLIRRTDGQLEINEISDEINEVWSFLNQQKKDYETVMAEKKSIMNKIALITSISKISSLNFFKSNAFQSDIDYIENPDTQRKTNSEVSFTYCCGLIQKCQEMQLQKLIFRVSKGNSLVEIFPLAKEELKKVIGGESIDYLDEYSLYFIMFEEGSNNVIHKKIEKVLATFANYYDIKNLNLASPNQEIETLKHTLSQKSSFIQAIEINTVKKLEHMRQQKPHLKCNNIFYFEVFIRREILIWDTINSGEMSGNFLTLEAYIPYKDLDALQNLSRQNNQQNFLISEHLNPAKLPTLYPETEVIEIPQAIVNTYGVPNSNQLNPAPLYIVTFGFFIGVMFGDVGHSLFGVIAMLMLKPNKWWWITVFWMFYCGVIYNEFFGLNLGWGRSCFTFEGDQITGATECTYRFGMDPVWKVAGNNMGYTNSFKMKFAVIVGVIHMMVGISIKAVNGVRNKNFIEVFAVALPQLIFMCVTFVYMDFLIVVKWLTRYQDVSKAPSIISTMINMALGKFDTSVSSLYPHQEFVEKILRLVIVCVVPYLLIAKPLILWIQHLASSKPKVKSRTDPKSKNIEMKELITVQQTETQRNAEALATDLTSIVAEEPIAQSSEDHHSMQDIIVHQLIETIEFVLGSVSNTASYLRLWALSLAHVQLSEVFFEMLLQSNFEKGTYLTTIPLFFLFIAFILVSFGILFCMDTMECFLHSLRLHWVEFQNKFFAGNGFLFLPINFNKQIQAQIST